MVLEISDVGETYYLCPECEEKYQSYDEAYICQKRCIRGKSKILVG
jgi:transcription initiation factor IIE alpha subunit